MTTGGMLIASIILLGALLRLVHLSFLDVGRPLDLGGLYAHYAEAIADNGYWLPRRVRYYADGGLPFAYPPLAFYVEALLVETLSIPKFLVVNFLPPIVSVLALLAFWVLLRQMPLNLPARALALVAYATMPDAYEEHLPAEGLAEAFGSLALCCLAVALVRAHRKAALRDYLVLAVAWAVCILASPGSAYASVPTLGIFALAQVVRSGPRRAFATVGRLVLTGVVAVALTSFYWLPVISNHGLDIFTVSAQSQNSDSRLGYTLNRLFSVRVFLLDDNPASSAWAVLIFLGFVVALAKRWLAPVAWFLLLMSIPREGRWMAAIPAAILAGMSADLPGLFVGVLSRIKRRSVRARPFAAMYWAGVAAGMLVVASWSMELISVRREWTGRQLPREAMAGMEWVRDHTPARAPFVVLANDNVKEWFPHLARRTEINNIFGAEWDPNKLERTNRLDERLRRCRDFACVGRETDDRGYKEIYVYTTRERAESLGGCQPSTSTTAQSASRASAAFEFLWGSGDFVVGRVAPDASPGPCGAQA